MADDNHSAIIPSLLRRRESNGGGVTLLALDPRLRGGDDRSLVTH
jgi:hypothetical protein